MLLRPLAVVPVYPFPICRRAKEAQTVEIVRSSVWHICKLLALSAPPGKVEGVCLECWPVVVDSHHFGGKGVSSDVETVDPFMKFSHDIFCQLTV